MSLDEGALILTSFDDEPDSLVGKMLQTRGFTITDSTAKTFAIPVDALRKIAALDHMKYTEQVRPIAMEDHFLWKRFCRKQEEMKNSLLSVCYVPEAVQELNLCIRSGGEIAGCVTGSKLSEESYELSYACVGAKQSWTLMPLLAKFRENLLKMGEPSARLSMTAVTAASVRLMEKLLPEERLCIGRKRAVFGGNVSKI